MNRKQLVVLWVMAVMLSAASIYHALQYESAFYGVAVPVLLIGAVLIVQFANLREATDTRGALSSGTNNTLAAALLIGNGLLIYQLQMQYEVDDSVASLESTTSSVESELGRCNVRWLILNDR